MQKHKLALVITRKYPLQGHNLVVQTHTVAWCRQWEWIKNWSEFWYRYVAQLLLAQYCIAKKLLLAKYCDIAAENGVSVQIHTQNRSTERNRWTDRCRSWKSYLDWIWSKSLKSSHLGNSRIMKFCCSTNTVWNDSNRRDGIRNLLLFCNCKNFCL